MKSLACFICAVVMTGCISPTEAMRMNAAAITDVAKEIHVKGTPAGTPTTEQLVKNAVTNEQILGSPEERIPPTDLEAQEANRAQAEKDAAEGGLWWKAGASALGVFGVLASWFGLTGVAGWLRRKSVEMVEWREKANRAENKARRWAGHFNTAAGAIKGYLGTESDDAHPLKEALRQKARDAGDKVDFDVAVRESLT